MIFICSLLFPLNDSKELGNQYIWGCYIEYAFAGIGFIWVIGLILSFILLVIGLINPILVKFERRDKLFYSLFIINNIALILISIIVILVNLLSYNLHGASSSCF
jgi:Mg2+/Co2+ transporter CorB